MFARMVIQKIKNLNPPGRFLKQNPNTGAWYEIGDKKAILKTRQALREGAPEIEKLLKNGAVVAKMVSFSTCPPKVGILRLDSANNIFSGSHLNIIESRRIVWTLYQ